MTDKKKCPMCGADTDIANREAEWACVTCGLTEIESLRGRNRVIGEQLAEAQLANERLRTVCAEWAEDVLLNVGMLETEGPRKGWHSSMARSEAIEAGDYLSLVGTWEIHPDGDGKMMWYRRKDSEK